MSERTDTWAKIRSKTQHFTKAELRTIKEAFIAKRSTFAVAKDLQCSQRTIQIHYARIRGGERGVIVKRARPEIQHHRKPNAEVGS